MAVLCRICSFLLLGASWPNLRRVHRKVAHSLVQPGNISKNKNMQRIRNETSPKIKTCNELGMKWNPNWTKLKKERRGTTYLKKRKSIQLDFVSLQWTALSQFMIISNASYSPLASVAASPDICVWEHDGEYQI